MIEHLPEAVLGWGSLALAALACLATVVEVSKIKLNPWSRLAKWLGRAINGEFLEKVDLQTEKLDRMEGKLNDLERVAEEREARGARVRILRFGDELLQGKDHSKEHFDQILQDITDYEQYCKDHPNFVNNMTKLTTEHIMRVYSERLDRHDFL